ncbi:MAG: efflux RND transporter permease subunit [Planctomycetota bacterium]|jgi:predicted RND superfamily exporter protein
MGLYDALILRRRWLPLLLVAAVTALLGWQLQHFKVDASSDNLILEGDPDLTIYEETRLDFVSDEYVLVACHLDAEHAAGRPTHPDDPFGEAGIAFIQDVTKRLAAIAGVSDVVSPTTVPLLRSFPGGVNLPALMNPDAAAFLGSTGIDAAKAREELTGHEVAGENLVSSDGRTVAFSVVFAKAEALDEAERAVRAIEKQLLPYRDAADTDPAKAVLLAERAAALPRFLELEAVRKAERRRVVGAIRAECAVITGETGVAFFMSGIPIIVIDMVTFIEDDMVVFGVGALAFLALVMAVIFRKIRWTLLPVLTCGITVVWILGVLAILDKKTTVVTSNLSSLLFIVGMAHAIHLVVKYRELAAEHPETERLQRIRDAVAGIVAPCLFTTLTTMVGFASLAISRIPPVTDFGYFMSLGVLLAFTLSFFFFPAALSLLPATRPRAADGAAGGRMRVLGVLGGLTLRAGPAVVLLSAACFAVSLWGASKIQVETMFIDYFRKDSELYKGLNFIDNNLGGTTTLEIVLHSPEENHFLQPEPYDKLAKLHAHMEDEAIFPEMGKIMSPVGVGNELAKLADHLHPMMLNMFLGQPTKREDVPRMGLLKGLQTPALKARLAPLLREVATEDFRTVRVYMRARETHAGLVRNDTIAKIRTYLEREMPEYLLPPPRPEVIAAGGRMAPRPHGRADITGIFVLYTNMLNSLIFSQITTFWVVFLGIWLMIGFFFHGRLWRARGRPAAMQPVLFVVCAAVACVPLGLWYLAGAAWPWPLLGVLTALAAVLMVPGLTSRFAPARAARWDADPGLWGALFLTWRVLQLAFIAMAPNVLPIAIVLGLMGWTGIRLDMATIMVASVSLGIAVDDTIHYIYRFDEEREAGGTPEAIVRRAHETIGQAIIYTSIAVIGGFWVLLLSNFKPTIYFGLFTGAAMMAAVFGSLTLLPVLLVWLRPLPVAEMPETGDPGRKSA